MNSVYRILLIEDDLDMHHAIRSILPEPEFHVTCCSTGQAGWEAMRQEPPDLLLLDIMLATPSEGFHICYQMKEDPRLRHVPVLMISAIGQRMGMDYARELGTDYVPADAFLEKPFDAAALVQTARQLLQSKVVT
jgi:DNA-binding response OmpR family regulator